MNIIEYVMLSTLEYQQLSTIEYQLIQQLYMSVSNTIVLHGGLLDTISRQAGFGHLFRITQTTLEKLLQFFRNIVRA